MSNRTTDDLHQELLDNISPVYQKTQGFPVWDILRAFAIGLKSAWDRAFEVESKQNVDNLTGEELEKFISQRKGLTRKQAHKASGEITIITGNGTIKAGDIFSTAGGVEFVSLETKAVFEGDKVKIEAVQAGSTGNLPQNTVTQMPVSIQGISEITNAEETADGYDAESDDDFRERYYEALREPATSGNVYHYKRWAKEVEGVGDAKVFSLWKGDNTVQVVIIDSEKLVPSEETVARCQEYIDPGIAGSGEGEAPVGAYCTVTAAEAMPINLDADITYVGDTEELRDAIKAALKEYLAEIAFNSKYVSIAKIGDLLINLDNVEDYDNLTINGSANRLVIPDKSVAIVGEVTFRNAAD